MMNKMVYWEDCIVVRPDSEWEDMRLEGHARLCANDEEYSYFNFPESFTDEQIRIALRFANLAYAKGFSHGKDDKAREIRRVLGVKGGE